MTDDRTWSYFCVLFGFLMGIAATLLSMTVSNISQTKEVEKCQQIK